MQLTSRDIDNLRRALKGGSLQRAYRGLLDYMSHLRTHFKHMHPKYSVSSVYQGYLDMTYFALVPARFKRRGLKIAVVFNFGAFRFEVWLSARNQGVHKKLWPHFEGKRWPDYRLVAPGTWVDSIVEHDLVDKPDFGQMEALTSTIDRKVAAFIEDMEGLLSRG
jgi:hypothetical protein